MIPSQFDRPIIGAINGVAITGGFELALACDILIASPQARFADTHARVGIMPGWGLSQKLSGMIGTSRAKEMSLCDNSIGADTAAQWGLVNRVVPAEELVEHCIKLGKDSASCLPHMVVKCARSLTSHARPNHRDVQRTRRARSRVGSVVPLSPR